MSRGRRVVLALALLGAAGCAAPPALDTVGPVVEADTLLAVPFGPTFIEARAVGIDPSGRLYVADAGRDVVVELDPAGLPLASLGGPGAGDYALLTPSGLDPTTGLALYVADAGNGRIQRFSRERQLTGSITVPDDAEAARAGRPPTGGRGRPVDVASAATGELYAVEAQRGVVLRWDERRALERVIGTPEQGAGALREPVALALDPAGRLFVADAGHRAVLVYDVYGQYLRRIADGTAPGIRSVAVGRGRLVVVLPGHVLLYGLDGRLDQALAFALPEPLADAVVTDAGLVLLTRTRLYRAGL